jgi:hypothetical protein
MFSFQFGVINETAPDNIEASRAPFVVVGNVNVQDRRWRTEGVGC